MEIKNPELYKFIINLDKDFKGLRQQHNDDMHVDLINGERKRVKLKDAVATIHDDVKKYGAKIDKIEEHTEFLVDFGWMHKKAKKYNLYWVMGVILSLFFSHNIWQPILLGLIEKL